MKRILQRMARDWNRRARSDPRYYVALGHPGHSWDDFLRSGQELVLALEKELDRFPFEHRAAVLRGVLDRVRRLPGVAAASSIHVLPMCCGNSGTGYYRTDRPAPRPGESTGGDVSVISEDYFRTMGIPMLGGREFTLRDGKALPRSRF